MKIYKDMYIDSFSGKKTGAFLLTHWHSDHVAGLTLTWNKGTIYCSTLTRKVLLRVRPYIPEDSIRALEPKKPLLINGIWVTLYDANHIAGSAMFYFEIPGNNILYTGDYRYHNTLALPAHVDTLYVDGTFHNYDARFLTLRQVIIKTHNWIETVETIEPFRYIAYLHVGTCELLRSLNASYGYTFHLRQENMSEEEYNVCLLMYPTIWNPSSTMHVIPIRKRNATIPLPQPILIPSAQWALLDKNRPFLRYLVKRRDKAHFRISFTNHSDKYDNKRLIRKTSPTTIYFV